MYNNDVKQREREAWKNMQAEQDKHVFVDYADSREETNDRIRHIGFDNISDFDIAIKELKGTLADFDVLLEKHQDRIDEIDMKLRNKNPEHDIIGAIPKLNAELEEELSRAKDLLAKKQKEEKNLAELEAARKEFLNNKKMTFREEIKDKKSELDQYERAERELKDLEAKLYAGTINNFERARYEVLKNEIIPELNGKKVEDSDVEQINEADFVLSDGPAVLSGASTAVGKPFKHPDSRLSIISAVEKRIEDNFYKGKYLGKGITEVENYEDAVVTLETLLADKQAGKDVSDEAILNARNNVFSLKAVAIDAVKEYEIKYRGDAQVAANLRLLESVNEKGDEVQSSDVESQSVVSETVISEPVVSEPVAEAQPEVVTSNVEAPNLNDTYVDGMKLGAIRKAVRAIANIPEMLKAKINNRKALKSTEVSDNTAVIEPEVVEEINAKSINNPQVMSSEDIWGPLSMPNEELNKEQVSAAEIVVPQNSDDQPWKKVTSDDVYSKLSGYKR